MAVSHGAFDLMTAELRQIHALAVQLKGQMEWCRRYCRNNPDALTALQAAQEHIDQAHDLAEQVLKQDEKSPRPD